VGDEFLPGDSHHFNCIFGLREEIAWRHERDRQVTLVVKPNSGFFYEGSGGID